MNGEIGAAGDAITGGLIARAVEPGHGEAGHGAHDGACLNCGAALTGAYCANCGQSAHIHRSLGAIWHDLAHGVLHFEGKIWRTLPELALRPGKLTRRFIAGERAKFVSPLALFLFSAFLMYGVYSLTAHHGGAAVQVNTEESAKELKRELAKADRAIADITAELRATDLSADRRLKLQARLEDAQEERNGLAAASNIVTAVTTDGGGAIGHIGDVIRKFREDPEFVAYKLKANAYKFSWLLILISTPLVWLLFAWKRAYGLYDHAIFVTYSIAFMSLLYSLWMLVSAVGVATGLITLALILFAMWHMYRQMKDAYSLSRSSALLRLPLLYLFASISGALFFAFLTAMS